MKKPVAAFIAGAALLQGFAAELSASYRQTEAEQVALWTSKLEEFHGKPPEAKLEALWLGLRNMGYRRTADGHSPAVDEIFGKIQDEMLSIPGHAQYFADRLAAARKKASDPWTDGRYHDEFRLILETMSHLRSPETVRMLGGMLESEEDPRSPEIDHDFFAKLEAAKKNGNGIGDSEPIMLCNPPTFAMGVFYRLGLRDLPAQSATDYYAVLKEYRAWWARLKSGELAFSFKGTKVKYCFKPDGTWETLAIADPPDDAPKPPPTRDRAKEQPATGQNPPARTTWWAWIVGGALALIAVVAWLRLRSRTPEG